MAQYENCGYLDYSAGCGGVGDSPGEACEEQEEGEEVGEGWVGGGGRLIWFLLG